MPKLLRAIQRTASDFKRHPWLHSLSVLTISAALLIMGGVFLCYQNVDRMMSDVNPNRLGTVYLEDRVELDQTDAISEQILLLPGVSRVVRRSRQQVLEEIEGLLGTRSGFREFGVEGIFPNILEIELEPGVSTEATQLLSDKVESISGVVEIEISEDLAGRYKSVREKIRMLSFVVIVALVGLSGFIVTNFMGVRYHTRKYEADVVSLVGGSKSIVVLPLVIEGLIEGLIGALFAIVLLYGLKLIGVWLASNYGLSLLQPESWYFLSPGYILLLLGVGISVASFSSLVALFRLKPA